MSAPPLPPLRELTAVLRELSSGVRGVVSFCVRDLATGEEIAEDGQKVFRLASVIKVPIALALFHEAERGALSLAEMARVDRVMADDDSGVLARFVPGEATLSLRSLAVLMLAVSDNTATNMLIDRIGMPAVNARLDALGFPRIRLRRKLLDGAAAARGEENVGTACDLSRLMGDVAGGRTLGEESTRALLAILETNALSTMRRLLPKGARVADKTGELDGYRASTGVLFAPRGPVALTVIADGLADERAGEALASEAARAVWRAFSA